MRAILLAALLSCCRSTTGTPTPLAHDASDTEPLAARKNAPPPAATYDTSCKRDTDCTPAPECCPVPCTPDVINVEESARAQDALDCDRSVPCPSAGGCRTFNYQCVKAQCKLVFYDDPDYHERQVSP